MSHGAGCVAELPYNNRLLLELFLSTPLEKRVSDQVHYDLIRHLNPAIDATGITITNYNETRARMYKEKLMFLFIFSLFRNGTDI